MTTAARAMLMNWAATARRRSATLVSSRRLRVITAGAAVLAVLGLPYVANLYLVYVVTVVLIYIPLALGQNLITGNSGQISMGHAAFFGSGAYVAAILSVTYQWPALAILIVAVLFTAALGLAVGLPAIRISGDYLFIVTIGVNLVFIDVVSESVLLTGGPSGITGVPAPTFGPLTISGYVSFYYFALTIAAIVCLFILAVVHSRLGVMIEAVRDDPIAAQASGISLTPTKLTVFVIGAGIAGLSGVAYAYLIGFVGPQDFTILKSLLIFEMVIIGGLGSVAGSIAGAFLLVGIPELVRPLQPYAVGLGGLAMLVLMVRRPQGILGKFRISNLVRS